MYLVEVEVVRVVLGSCQAWRLSYALSTCSQEATAAIL